MSSEEQQLRQVPPPVEDEDLSRGSEGGEEVRTRCLSKDSSSNSSLSPMHHQNSSNLPDPASPAHQDDKETQEEGGEIEDDDSETNTNNSIDFNNYRNDISNLVALSEQLQEANSQLDSRLHEVDEALFVKQGQVTAMQTQVRELQSRLQQLEQTQKEEARALGSIAGGAEEDEESVLARAAEIESQIAIYERLKADEKTFKRNCNAELERLTAMLEQTKKQADDDQISDAELQAQLEKAEHKLEAGRQELGNINRKLALIQRQIEQIPHRVELREYRLRFTELYNQVSATHRQTKQYFSLYNSLEDSKRYLEKEHSLLNSIIDSYQEVGCTPAGREEFLKQLAHIHDGMKESCSKVDRRYKSEKVIVDKLQHDLQHLLDQKVNYEKCLKELDADCKLNERLLAQLMQIEQEEENKSAVGKVSET